MKPGGVDVWGSLNPTLPSPKGRVRLEIVIAIEQGGAQPHPPDSHAGLPKGEGLVTGF